MAGVQGQPRRILDLGCGNGQVWRAIDWPVERFVAIDNAPAMLASHPDDPVIAKIAGDFDYLGADLPVQATAGIDLLVSASALHWSRDLKAVLHWLRALPVPQIALALFTAETFKALHRFLGLTSPIPPREQIIAALTEAFGCRPSLYHDRLYFADTRTMLRYVKQSGVSGGRHLLSVSQARHLLRYYPHAYLTFEVALLWWRRSAADGVALSL